MQRLSASCLHMHCRLRFSADTPTMCAAASRQSCDMALAVIFYLKKLKGQKVHMIPVLLKYIIN